MYRAKDHKRDQSYFLFSTTQAQLDYLRFPLGNIEKDETRSIAKKLNLNVADKPDSQDICFVPNGDYSSVIKKFRPESFKKGKIIDLSGNQIGEHDGIINYTIGQRKGIKISSSKPLYVININADENTVIVGQKENLEIKKQLFKNIEKYRTKGSIISSNTSGIPIESMLNDRSSDFCEYFCGTHFFNPPRYLKLLEIIPSSEIVSVRELDNTKISKKRENYE